MCTIIEQIRRGKFDCKIEKIAERENVTKRFLLEIASERIVIPCNPAHDPVPTRSEALRQS